jgi:hypothetical protein
MFIASNIVFPVCFLRSPNVDYSSPGQNYVFVCKWLCFSLLLSLFPLFFLLLVCKSLIRLPESTAFACFSLQLVEFVLPVVLVPVICKKSSAGEEREQFHAYYMSYHYKLSGIR